MITVGRRCLCLGVALTLGVLAQGPMTFAASLPGGSPAQVASMLMGGWTAVVQNGHVVTVDQTFDWPSTDAWGHAPFPDSAVRTGGSLGMDGWTDLGIPLPPSTTTVVVTSPPTSATVHTGGATSPSPVVNAASEQASTVLQLVNQQRAMVDAPPLTLDARLSTLAQQRVDVLAADRLLTHDVPGYGYAAAMETTDGVGGTLIGGEDLSTGNTLLQAFYMLVTSPPHEANIDDAAYNALGVGISKESNGTSQGIVVLDLLFLEN